MTQIIVTTADDLRQIIRAEVQDAVQAVAAPRQDWLSRADFAAAHGISVSTVDTWVRKGVAEAKNAGKARRFRMV